MLSLYGADHLWPSQVTRQYRLPATATRGLLNAEG